MEAVQSHSDEEIEAERNDLNIAEDEATEEDHSEDSSNESEDDTSKTEDSEEEVIDWKARAEKAELERDNYKQGMLSAKAKKRNLEEDAPRSEHPDVNEAVVLEVLGKQSEKKALQNTIDAKHQDYIPELVDDTKYNEIIAYLPRNMDKSDYGSIVKSLKLATKLWKEDKGIKDPVQKKNSVPGSKTTLASGGAPSKPASVPNKFARVNTPMTDWYKK